MKNIFTALLLLLVGAVSEASVRFFNASTAEIGIFTEVKCGNGVNCAQSVGRLELNAGKTEVQQVAASRSLSADDCGTTFIQSAASVLTLPEASLVLGCKFTFVVNAVANMDINPNDGTDQILLLTNAAGDAIRADAVGESIVLQSVGVNSWAVVGKEQGTYSDVNQTMNSLVKNAADEEQVKKAESKLKRVRERELADIHQILQSQYGRRFYWRYLTECKVFETSFSHSGSITAFNEGVRNVGLKLLTDLNEASPDSYLTMLKESKENQ